MMIVLNNNSFMKVSSKVILLISCAILILKQNGVTAASLHNPESSTNSPIIDNKIPGNEFSEVCSTSVCQQEASFYLNLLNEEVDPCDNFYQFACGNIIKNANIPKDSDKYTIIDSVKKKIDQQLLFELQNHNPNDSITAKKIKTFYQNCVREPEPESIQLALDKLNEFGGMPLLLGKKWNEESFDWVESILKSYKSGVPLTFPGIVVWSINKNNTSKLNTLNILSPRVRMNRKFFMNDSDKKLLEAYRDYMIDIMVMLGANKTVAVKEMTDCFDFEVKLFKIKSPLSYLRNATANYNPMTIKKLSELSPNVPWLKYLNGLYKLVNITFNEDDIAVVRDPVAMEKLGKLMSETPKKLLANYLMWQVIFEMVDFLPEQFLDRYQAYLSVTEGIEERKSRSMMCIDMSMSAANVGMSALYVQKYINKGSRENATALIHTMQGHFAKMLNENEWMDEKTKKSALEKLLAMDFFVGYYPEIFDNDKIDEYYKSVNIYNGSYMASAFNWSQFNAILSLNEATDPMNKTTWAQKMPAPVVNAYYKSYINEIEIAASLLQQPFYHLERPQYLNYGVLGQVIGHEITHGFDSEGRKLDKHGNRTDWWEPAAQQQYIEKTKCFVNKYSNYTVEQIGLHLNGEHTLRENIADFGGFKVAYGAYVDWATRNNIIEPRLPGLNYTPRQMYWISLAGFYCGKFNKQYLIDETLEGSHSPWEARVVLTMSNLPEFAEDFSCKPGTKMNPVDKCNLW